MPEMSESEMGNPQVTQIEIAWLAGIWDGEGTISVRRNKKINQFSPRVTMVNTNAAIIRKVADILTRMGIGHYLREKGEGGFSGSSRQCWIVSIETLEGAKQFLKNVRPLLVGKTYQAELLEMFVRSRISRRSLVTRNSECRYSEDELDAVTLLYRANGDQRGTSETVREASANNRVMIQSTALETGAI